MDAKEEDMKTFVTTDKAGWVVAGQRVPPVYPKDGGEPTPKVGHEIRLTAKQAEYWLAQGAIEPKKEAVKAASKAE